MALMAGNHSDSETSLRPEYFVPENFFVLSGPGEVEGNWKFKCVKCYNTTISASYKTRYNLKKHVVSKHRYSLAEWDTKIKDHDKRRNKVSLLSWLDCCSGKPNFNYFQTLQMFY
jgi:hypothetical protein